MNKYRINEIREMRGSTACEQQVEAANWEDDGVWIVFHDDHDVEVFRMRTDAVKNMRTIEPTPQ